MKSFLKPSVFKIVLTILLAALPVSSAMLYDNWNISPVSLEGFFDKIANSAIKILYYISYALFLPWTFIRGLIENGYGWLNYVALLFYFAYCYLLSCVISYFVNLKKNK